VINSPYFKIFTPEDFEENFSNEAGYNLDKEAVIRKWREYDDSKQDDSLHFNLDNHTIPIANEEAVEGR